MNRGYYIVDAAEALNLSHSHVSRVLSGERESAELMEQLRALPKRKLRAITHRRKEVRR